MELNDQLVIYRSEGGEMQLEIQRCIVIEYLSDYRIISKNFTLSCEIMNLFNL